MYELSDAIVKGREIAEAEGCNICADSWGKFLYRDSEKLEKVCPMTAALLTVDREAAVQGIMHAANFAEDFFGPAIERFKSAHGVDPATFFDRRTDHLANHFAKDSIELAYNELLTALRALGI